MHLLDVAQNALKAGAKLVEITVAADTAADTLHIRIKDDGCGMSPQQLQAVTDPFFTTRTTRKVGLGVPFFKMSAEATGGSFSIVSQVGKGTTTTARYNTGHIDMLPVGDMNATILSLITMNPDMDFVYRHERDGRVYTLDTRELKAVLEDVPLNTPEIAAFLKESLEEGEAELCAPAQS